MWFWYINSIKFYSYISKLLLTRYMFMVMASQRCHFIIFWPHCFYKRSHVLHIIISWYVTCHTVHWLLSRLSLACWKVTAFTFNHLIHFISIVIILHFYNFYFTKVEWMNERITYSLCFHPFPRFVTKVQRGLTVYMPWGNEGSWRVFKGICPYCHRHAHYLE